MGKQGDTDAVFATIVGNVLLEHHNVYNSRVLKWNLDTLAVRGSHLAAITLQSGHSDHEKWYLLL
jgi:hypothetical protein